jgi:N-methylhydantoinase B
MRGFKNSSQANTASATYMALASFLDPALPRNEGSFRAVEIVAPEGSVVNPRYPAPMTMCTVFVAHEIVHAIWKALAQVDPARACAGWGKSISGVTAGDGGRRFGEQPFVMYHWNVLPGAGAVAGRDGFNQIGHLITLGGLTLPNVEVFEQLYPMRFRRQEFRADGGGPGRWRGGTGVDYEVEVEVPATHSFRGEGLLGGGGFGVGGGGTGIDGEMELDENDERRSAPRYDVLSTGPLTLRASSPGGGGWGDPLERDPLAVVLDVRNGVVSRQAAEEVYGVVLNDEGELDEAASRRLRTRINVPR